MDFRNNSNQRRYFQPKKSVLCPKVLCEIVILEVSGIHYLKSSCFQFCYSWAIVWDATKSTFVKLCEVLTLSSEETFHRFNRFKCILCCLFIITARILTRKLAVISVYKVPFIFVFEKDFDRYFTIHTPCCQSPIKGHVWFSQIYFNSDSYRFTRVYLDRIGVPP